MKFYKTIRFKLTLWYSLLFIISSGLFLLASSLTIQAHYEDRLPEPFKEKMPFVIQKGNGALVIGSIETENETRDMIEKTREADFQQIQKILVFFFFIMAAISFGLGYFIAGRMLKPIKKINATTKKINSHNLSTQIDHEDIGDELSEMINNINEMIARLNTAFSLQKQFIENASHELKTPLAIINTNLDLAKIDNAITDQEALSYIDTAIRSTRFMNKLIEDLLLLSLAEKDIKFQEVNIKDILNETISQLKVVAEDKNMFLKLRINQEDNFNILGNRELLQRAFMNIIENAMNYSPEKSEINIQLIGKDGKVIISIADHGIGIPEDKINKIFERFYRVDKSRSKKSGGTGLGLAITKKIITLHQGKILVKSELAKGTEFKIAL